MSFSSLQHNMFDLQLVGGTYCAEVTKTTTLWQPLQTKFIHNLYRKLFVFLAQIHQNVFVGAGGLHRLSAGLTTVRTDRQTDRQTLTVKITNFTFSVEDDGRSNNDRFHVKILKVILKTPRSDQSLLTLLTATTTSPCQSVSRDTIVICHVIRVRRASMTEQRL